MHKHKEKKEVEKPQRRPQRRKWCTKAFHTTSPRRDLHIGGLSGKRRSSKSNDTWDPCHVTIKQKKTPRKSTKIVFLVSYSSVACNATCTNKILKLHERQVICVGEWEEASSAGTSPTRGAQASRTLHLAVAPHPTSLCPYTPVVCMLSCSILLVPKKQMSRPAIYATLPCSFRNHECVPPQSHWGNLKKFNPF